MSRVLSSLGDSAHVRLVAIKVALLAALTLAVTELSVAARLDVSVNREVHELAAGWLTGWVSLVTDLAGTQWMILLTAGAFCVLAALRHWRGALALVISVATTQVAVAAVKLLVARPRPDEHLGAGHAEGFSFPSAHSATAVALYAMLALIAASMMRGRARTAAYLAAGLIVLAVGASRIYLGAHYPTDVLAGWITGGILVAASWGICAKLPQRAARPV